MNSESKNIYTQKASRFACLFLFIIIPIGASHAQEWVFDENTKTAYNLVLNLHTEKAKAMLPDPQTAQEQYVHALADAIELLITEDGERYEEYHDAYQNRLDKKSKSSLAEDMFLHAELRLQWTFVYLKFGHEFDAAYNLRQAYIIADECKKRFPKFTAIQKTSGLLEIIVGSVPEKYNWVLHLLGMQGSIEKGLKELQALKHDSPFSFETQILYALIHGFVFQQPAVAVSEMKSLLQENPQNPLALFLGASLAIKNSQSEDALQMLTRMEQLHDERLPLYYSYYLKGEVYLHKGDYLNSITAYRWFITHYTGQNYVKDAHYKIGLCYWLNGNINDAHVLFKQARSIGKESAEADKYAARSLSEKEMPHIELSKIRYYTDGGYYREAQLMMDSITTEKLPTQRDQTEFYYRKARLFHKTNQISEAKEFYTKTIDSNGDHPWYFAPNSCLQLGYIFSSENKYAEARTYFQHALEYKRHEYKNSIDSKAKSALAQLSTRK